MKSAIERVTLTLRSNGPKKPLDIGARKALQSVKGKAGVLHQHRSANHPHSVVTFEASDLLRTATLVLRQVHVHLLQLHYQFHREETRDSKLVILIKLAEETNHSGVLLTKNLHGFAQLVRIAGNIGDGQ